jgi:PII-like signaling protein
LSGATVLLGVDGTRHGARTRAGFFARNIDVPRMIISVGAGDQIARVLPELTDLLRDPVLTLERIRVCKRDGELFAPPHELPGTDEHGLALWQKLMIHTSESDRFEGHPVHRALMRRLRESGVAGATSLAGVWGFRGDHAPHGDKLLQVHRHVPVVTIVVDRPDRIAEAFRIVDGMTQDGGLVTSEIVPAATAAAEQERRGGVRLARHRF